jgi:pimeloyl-ACP methyl ester carboxylesterase
MISFANVNGIKICYEIQGQGDSILLVHGFGSKKETWQAQFGPLSNHFKVIRFDNRGAGKSDRPNGPYSLSIFADDIRGLMDFLKIEKAHVIGWSLGGMIVQEFLLRYPERVCKAVLINTSYTVIGDKGDTKFAEMYKNMRLKEVELNKQDPEASFWKAAKVNYYHEFRKKMEANPKKKFFGLWSVEDVVKERTIDPQTPKDIENQAKALENFYSLDRLHQIKNPVLLLTASHDKVLPKTLTIEMHKIIPNNELKIIEKAGHASPREKAPEINKIIVDFLKK